MDDDSGFDDLKGELDEYVQKYLSGNIKVQRNVSVRGWLEKECLEQSVVQEFWCFWTVIVS